MVSVPSFPNAPIMNMKQASLVKASLFSLKPFHQTIPKKYYFQGGSRITHVCHGEQNREHCLFYYPNLPRSIISFIAFISFNS